MRLGTRIAFALLSAVVVAGFFLSANEIDLAQSLASPNIAHPAGTDQLGRDMLLRAISGGSHSVLTAALAWLGALAVGVFLGVLASIAPSKTIRESIRATISLGYTVPFFPLVVAGAGAAGLGNAGAYIVLVAVAWVVPARQTDLLATRLMSAQFVVANRALGYPNDQLARFVLLPEIAATIVIPSVAVLPEILALDAALAFFGLGPPLPQASLGSLVVSGIDMVSVAPWVAICPILMLASICFALRTVVQGGKT